jgi:hypothetical protein
MKKIMFNDRYGLTAAVLEGRKTQTRRIIKELQGKPPYSFTLSDFGVSDKGKAVISAEFEAGEFVDIYPKYQFGEVVAVAQPYGNDDVCKYQRQLLNVKDNSKEEGYMIGLMMSSKGWGNKMFAKAYFMPHQIQIENIRYERLQDISDEDCMAEGVLERRIQPFNEVIIKYQVPFTTIYKDTPREAYAALIDKVSGKETWESNPWVFVYDFKLIK